MATEEETYLAVLKASYDYDPQPDAEDEIAIKEDQLLFLLARVEEDWWRVKVKTDTQDEEGISGLVPSAYVELAGHTSVVKALYDYDAQQSTELTVKEDEILYVYDQDEDWLLVSSTDEDGRVGYVPANYVEEATEDGATEPPPSAGPSLSQIVVPPSPPRPAYVDPADRVASNKAQADDIKTWAISEVDKKGKKKKGTLGVGNGAIFFASESDKTPVQKWQTSDIQACRIDKSKHVYIDIGGPTAANLHFHAGSKDVAEAILVKLEASRALSAPPPSTPGPSSPPQEPERPRSGIQKAVHFDVAAPVIIPSEEIEPDEEEPEPEPEHYEEDQEEHPVQLEGDGEPATALYDFTADGDDELTVHEGEPLLVLERDTDEWWKCRNANGDEGVVPASYIELSGGLGEQPEEDMAAIAAAQAASQAAQETEERIEAARKKTERERAERERAEKERKREAEQRAKAAAAEAEENRKKREREREKQKEREREQAAEARQKEDKRKSGESSSKGSKKANGDSRSSTDKRPPPPDEVRLWHDRTGQFKVHAAFLGFNEGKLRLHKTNGVVIEVPAEKMSAEDIRYVESVTKPKSPPARKFDDDDEPLATVRKTLIPGPERATSARSTPPKKAPTVDWFEFFLNAGCDLDDCTRYSQAFERDKIDEAILGDITESTMRSLGLREGDIIRVKKHIATKQPKSSSSFEDAKSEQLRRDEELARQLQAEENSGKRGQAPNLFAGPNGALKGPVRRGRPQPSKTLPPASVDINSIASASDQIQRTSTPMSPGTPTTSTTPVNPPARASSAAPVMSGFDDDAWTNRPTSTKPATPAPTAAAPRAPSAPPAPPPPPAPAPVSQSQSLPTPASAKVASPGPTQSNSPSLAKMTEADIFNQLAQLSQLRVASPVSPPKPPSAPIISAPPASYHSGLGMGSSPVPMGQHIQAQQTGFLPSPATNGPRGPYAPVPTNQSLLQPLVPTTTGFNSFVPTRPQSTPSAFQPNLQPSFLPPQPTGFSGLQPIPPQPTGFPSQPLWSQPTGFPNGGYGNFNSNQAPPVPPVPPLPPMPQNNMFGHMQPNPTGFNPGFGSAFNSISPPPPPPPPQPPAPNTNPANIFAQMKSGTFAANDNLVPQSADRYDALRPNPMPLTAQPTGWVYQNAPGYGYNR